MDLLLFVMETAAVFEWAGSKGDSGMDRIAFFFGEMEISWSFLIGVMAVGTGVCLFWALYMGKGNGLFAAVAAVPLTLALSLLLARLLHWYCRPDLYESLRQAVTDYSTGGYALPGAFAGCVLSALLLRLVGISKSLPRMLDCMSLAGCAAMGLGRLAFFFRAGDRGWILPESIGLPWAYPEQKPISGMAENRFAVFLLQAVAAGVIFLAVLIPFLREKDNRKMKDGDACLLVLLLWGAAQLVLDGTRYDALFPGWGGFLSLTQLFGMGAVVLPVLVFSVRMVKAYGFRFWYLPAWAVIAAMLGLAVYMEYYVQQHEYQPLFIYGCMGVCMMDALAVAWILWYVTIRRERLQRLPTIY